MLDDQARAQLDTLAKNCADFGVRCYGLGDQRRGIVHVMGPELGLTQPGMTIVCGDSHTATHGAFGALAFGIGSSEVEHVLATQCLLQRRPTTLEVRVDGTLPKGVTAKDLILAVIARIGVDGGTGAVIEYTRHGHSRARHGSAHDGVQHVDRSGRARRPHRARRRDLPVPRAPRVRAAARRLGRGGRAAGARCAATRARATTCRSRSTATRCADDHLGHQSRAGHADHRRRCPTRALAADEKALRYMDLEPGKPLVGRAIDVVFVGSCTNGRIADLRQAARILDGRHVAKGVRTLVVPGSHAVKKQAEAEGLDRIFLDAGAEWREPGCSMCIAMNGDQLEPGQYAVSTSNRNFEGRQGRGGRTFLASPLTAAAAAVTGRVTDPRVLL